MARNTSRTARLLAVAAVAAFTFTACAAPGTDTSESSAPHASGGNLVVAAFNELPGFDPIRLTAVGTGIERAAQIFDTLLYRDEATDEVLPKLAAGITSSDGVTWVLALREGVEFTDGTPLDADAVIFNLERHLAPESTSAAKSMLSGVTSLEASEPYEVTITLNEANGSFPLALTAASPASLIGSPEALSDPEAFNTEPVGAGAFLLESWTPDNELRLVRNPDYWDEGLPYLDGVTFRVLPDNHARTDAVLSGDVQLAQINSDSWDTIGGVGGLNFIPIPTGGRALVPNGSTAPTDDQRIREAIFRSLDPTVSLKVVFGSSVTLDPQTIACAPFPVDSPVCDPEMTYTFDPDRARELVEEYASDGGEPALEIVYFQTQTAEVTYVQQQLKSVGINATLKSVDAAGLGTAQASGDYGIFWGSTASAGFPTVWTRYYSEGTNWGMVTYPQLDAALMNARNPMTLDGRTDGWREVNRIIHDNAVLQWVLPYPSAMVSSEKLRLGTAERPYIGSTMVYFDTAALAN